ncbi:MAG: UPF0149 family protein [Methylococcaceae bacterium]|jgi:hypothetical protein
MVYQIVENILAKADVEASAAEAHGMAAGMLCLSSLADSSRWMGELLQDAQGISDEDRKVLLNLFDQTRILLASEQFEFDLFLPDDEAGLSERTTALSLWCQGFLFGIGTMATGFDRTGDIGGILKDITEFTKLEVDEDDMEDENAAETAYTEVTEYLRSAVLLLRDQLETMAGNTVH